MKRALTIIHGEGKGTRRALESSLVLIGRASEADIRFQDPNVSRRHLEVQIDKNGVWATNRSDRGSVLNGNTLVGTVSLNDGDVLEIGGIKLRYDEIAPEPAGAAAQRPARPDITHEAAKIRNNKEPEAFARRDDDPTEFAEADSVGRTKAADTSGWGKDKESPRDGTQAFGQDKTKVMDPDQLVFIAREPKKSAGSKAVRAVLALVVLAGAVAGAFWYQNTGQPNLELVPYKEPSGKFTIDYPGDWPKLSDKSDFVIYGTGDPKSQAWVQLRISVDSDAEIDLTGLTAGFKEYANGPLLQQFPGATLDPGFERHYILNDVITTMLFRFSSKSEQGLGIYLLDGDTRIVVVGVGAPGYYEKFDPLMKAILRSFSLRQGGHQQFIDFPMPDAIMRTEATGDPGLQEQNILEHMRLGEALLAAKDVKPENLYNARQQYREAVRWSIARVEPLKDQYRQAAEGLRKTETLLREAVEDQRFRIRAARAKKDYQVEQWAALQLMQTVPDKTDPAYQEAYDVWRNLAKMKERR